MINVNDIYQDMINVNNSYRGIKFNFDDEQGFSRINFNPKDQLILHNEKTIWTYSADDKSWVREKIPKDYRLVSVSNNKRYLLFDNYICEWSDNSDMDFSAKSVKRIFADKNTNDVI